MRMKQANPVKQSQKYKLYQHSALTDAYNAVVNDKSSVTSAAKRFHVPEQTLRDRVKGKIDIDCVAAGRTPTLSLDEEVKLVDHLKSVSKYGYGYTRQEVVDIASNYAFQLGKRKPENPFTLNWFVHFVKRWPELRVLKPRSLEIQRAKNTSSTVVSNYFNELEEILDKYSLKDKPHLIFNVDEKGISQNHAPPYVVGTVDFHPQAVTAGKSQTTTIIGCGSSSGVAIPPYFVFAGKRMMPDLMKGATPGAGGTVSESGWSNSEIFHKYLTEHFVKFIPQREPGQHLLLLLDGHKSHVSVELVQWAKNQNIILFVLPAHTSHVLQPMDVACYGPFQNIFNNLCHKLNRESSSTVTRYDICHLGCAAYSKALSIDNLHSAFRKTGIYPFNRDVIAAEAVAPAEIFADNSHSANVDVNIVRDHDVDEQVASPSNFMAEKLKALQSVKKTSPKNPRKTLSKIVSGKAVTENNVEKKIIAHKSTQNNSSTKKCQYRKRKCNRNDDIPKRKKLEIVEPVSSPQPGPSTLQNKPSHLEDSDSDDNESEISEEEKCCICKLFTPKEIKESRTFSVIFTKWVQCDVCPHWVHLGYCSQTRVIRRGEKFYCPHCEQ